MEVSSIRLRSCPDNGTVWTNAQSSRTIEDILCYDREGMPDDVASQLTGLRDRMIQTSFHSRLQRYAGMDLLHDQIDRDGKRRPTEREGDIRKLAEEVLERCGSVDPRVAMAGNAQSGKNGYRFGHALGQLDAKC